MMKTDKIKNFFAVTSITIPCSGATDCNWDKLFQLFNNILSWIVWASVPVATITIAYAGWLYIWGGAKEGNVSEGKKILTSAIIGLATVLAAALIVKAILFYLTKSPEYQNFIG